jgi:hypothetical protein
MLRRTRLTDAADRPADDDYRVIEDGQTIGRIYRSAGFRDGEWFWATMRFPSSGNQSGWARAFEEAKTAFGRQACPTRAVPTTWR